MLDTTSGAYYFSLSSNWISVTTPNCTTCNHALLGNAFIIDGLVQLYTATGNSTYLLWASHTAEQFWKKGWDPVNGGFYDYYYSSWANTTCIQTLQNNAMFAIAFLNLYATNGSSVWLQRASSVVSLINNRFWDPSAGVGEVSYDVCTKTLSGDVQIEVSVGSYLWAISQWTEATGSTAYVSRMESTASFAWSYLWDGPSNTLPGGPNSVGCTAGGYLGFMRSVYANLTGLEDCRKGANEDAWGAMGLAYLYNVTGNAVYKDYAEQALSWLNGTLWDPTYGGFHQDTFRNNTLRSACSSTNDPRDYPGWTEGEQPWLLWSIGHLLDVPAYDRGALVSEQWTATHQWNSTANNGGDMTCLNSNTQPDKGNSWIYDWIQGSALHTYSILTTMSSTTTTTASTSSSTTTSSSTAAGSSLALDGSASHYVANTASTAVTLSTSKSPDVIIVLATIDSASLHVTSVSSTHLTFTMRTSSIGDANHYISEWYAIASSPLSSEVITIANSGTDNMNVEAFGISGANTASPFDSNSVVPSVSYSSTGSTTPATKISTSNANDFIFGLLASQYASSQTVTKGSAFIVIFSDATGHPNIGSEYEVVSATQSGLSVNWVLGKSEPWAVIADAVKASGGVTVSQPIATSILESGAPTGETYTVNGCSPSPTTGTVGGTTTFTMQPSCSFTISFSNTGGTRVGFISGGSFSATSSSQSTCASGTCTPATFNMDYQTQLTVNNGNGVTYSMSSETGDHWYKYGDTTTVSSNGIYNRGSGTGIRVSSWNIDGGSNTNVATIGTVTTSSVTMTAAHTVNFNTATQYQIAFVNSPTSGGTSVATTSPTISGDTGWYDSGTGVSISATANSGYTFSAWTGTGTGSYSGTSNPASVTMSAAIQETAAFTSSSGPTLALDGSAGGHGLNVASVTATLSTNSNPDVIIAFCTIDSPSLHVSGITASGLSFTKRVSSTGNNNFDVEEWYAIASSKLTNVVITCSNSGTDNMDLEVFGISGANTGSPFDTHTGIPAVTDSSSGSKIPATTITTSNANDMIIGLVATQYKSGQSLVKGSAYTLVMSDAIGHPNVGSEYEVVSTTQSGLSVGWTLGASEPWTVIADAVV